MPARFDPAYASFFMVPADDGSYMRCKDCLVPIDVSREVLGEAIYRAMYQHVGGDWRANETRDVWYEMADSLKSILSFDPERTDG